MMGQICFHWVCISIKSSHFLFKFLMANDLVQSILKTEIIATAAAARNRYRSNSMNTPVFHFSKPQK